MSATDTSAVKKCPVCRKEFVVLYQNLWRYKRGSKWMCSWKCLRAYDKKGEEKKVGYKRIFSNEQEAEAVKIALEGGNPLKYQEEHGSTNPPQKWYEIKVKVKERDPETYAKLPKRITRKDAAQLEVPEVHTVEDAAAMVHQYFHPVEMPEQPKITKPLNYDGLIVREVEGKYGRYRFVETSTGRYIDYEEKDGTDTISATVEQWRDRRAEMNHAALVLGVEL